MKEAKAHAFRGLMTAARFLLLSVAIAPAVLAASLSQGYKSATELTPGTLVSLDRSAAETVQPANTDRTEDLVGVVVPDESSSFAVGGGEGTVQVATSGVASVIVSDINGDIKTGDRITTSPISGAGMKATLSTKIVGVAQEDFSSDSEAAVTQQVRDRSGGTKQVALGQIQVLVEVTYFVSGAGNEKTVIPKWLQNITDTIAGKKVSPVRVIVSVILLILSLGAVTILIYGAIKSSIISIGRNPLSHGAIRKSLVQVLVVASVILVVSFGAIYLIISR